MPREFVKPDMDMPAAKRFIYMEILYFPNNKKKSHFQTRKCDSENRLV